MYTTDDKKSWGEHIVIGRGDGYKVKRLTFHPHKSTSVQFHHYRSELMQCVEGTVEVIITELDKGEKFNQLKPTINVLNVGDFISVPVHTIHQIRNQTDANACIIEIQTGQDDMLEEFDICRLDPRGINNYPT